MKIELFNTGPLQVNTYLVYDGNVGLVVDPGGVSSQLESRIDELKLDMRYILLTHAHGDHIGGVAWLKDLFPNLEIIAGVHEEKVLTDPRLNMSDQVFRTPITVQADRLVKEGDEILLRDAKFNVIETPGHTCGGICFYCEREGVLFSGDTLFYLSIGRTDFGTGDYNTLISSVQNKLYLLPDSVVVYPGHMQSTTIGNEKRYNPFVHI